MDEAITNQNNDQQPKTQPAGNGDQGSGKMFTQEEVNNIVKDRLARERAKNTPPEPTEEDKQHQALNDRESRIACREYIMDQGLPRELLDVLDTSNHEDFKAKADIVSGLLKSSKASRKEESPTLIEMKRRIAYEKGIPQELAIRLSGESETDIYRDAEAMIRIVRAIKGPAPLFIQSDGKKTTIADAFVSKKHKPKNYYQNDLDDDFF